MSANGGTDLPKTHADVSAWRKSSYSGVMDCVELTRLGDGIGIRDSKRPDADPLNFSREQLVCVLDGIKSGELDDLLA